MAEEDLLQWKQEARERIDTLQRYDYTLRTVQGRLNQLTYNVNSSITRMADERKAYRDLEKQLRETKRAFKQDFPDVPCSLGGIERAISHYESIRASIDRQLENQERLSHLEHSSTTQGWSDLVAEAARCQRRFNFDHFRRHKSIAWSQWLGKSSTLQKRYQGRCAFP